MKESLSVNVCKIFVRPLKYLLLLYNLPEDGGTCNCFYSKFGKDAFFYVSKKRTGILYPHSLFLGVLELAPGFGGLCGGLMTSCS